MPTLKCNGYFLFAPYSGQGVVTKQYLEQFATLSKEPIDILLPWEPDEQVAVWLKERGYKSVYPKKRRRSLRLHLLWWERVWIPKHIKGHRYLSFYAHPMRKVDAVVWMILHDTFQLEDPLYKKKITRKVYNLLLRGTLNREDIQLLTVSKWSATQINSLLKRQVGVQYNGNDHLPVVPRLSSGKDLHTWRGSNKPFVFYQGGYDQRKNIPELIKAMRIVRETTELELVLGGGALHSSALYLDPKLLEQPWIHTPGFLTDEELAMYYSTCAVFVHPSRAEGWNLAIGEALQHGSPVVASDIPVHKELWAAYVTLYPLGNPQACAKHIVQALQQPHEVQVPYTWLEQAKKLLVMLQG